MALNGNTGINRVLITVTGCQRDAHGVENTIELFTCGHSYMKNGVHYISYRETEVTGLDGATTLLKIYADYVILVRTGRVEQRQEFRTGKRCSSSYVTPYGTMRMGVRTKYLTITRCAETDQVCGVDIEYELEIDGQWQSSNKLAVIVQGDKKNEH